MSSITEAIFKGRIRSEAPPAGLTQTSSPLNSQLLTRKAIEAVLAGGYDTCRKSAPARPDIARPDSGGVGRSVAFWVAAFALAGLIGVATSQLPSHLVKARQASRHEVKPSVVASDTLDRMEIEKPAVTVPAMKTQEIAMAAPPPAPAVAQPAAQAVAAQAVAVQAQAAPQKAVLSLTTLHPLAKTPAPAEPRAQKAAVIRSGNSAAGSQAPPAGSVAARVPLEEVLYEGVPASSGAVSANADVQVAAAVAADPDRSETGSGAKGASKADDANSGALKVTGIFWDKTRPMALINGKIVEIGTGVGAFKVEKIQPSVVVLRDESGAQLDLRP